MMRKLGALAMAVALTLAGCSSSSSSRASRSARPTSSAVKPAPPKTTVSKPARSARIGQAFVNHGFKIVVTSVRLGAKSRPVSGCDSDANLTKPDNGQFVVIYLTVSNVSAKPQAYGLGDNATLVDAKGREYDESQDDIDDCTPQFGDSQQPDTTARGFITFDVPTSVMAVRSVAIQPDPIIYEHNPATVVNLA